MFPQALPRLLVLIFSVTTCLLCKRIEAQTTAPQVGAQLQEKAPPQKREARSTQAPQIERLEGDRLKVGAVIIDRKTRRVEVPAEVNMTQGILEYYGVIENGKLHESVLKINATPSHIHLALILAGYEPTQYGKPDQEGNWTINKAGTLLRLYMKWRPSELAREQWVPASAWLFDRSLQRPPPSMTYIFSGSLINEQGYAADLDKSVIGLISDPTVVLSLAGNNEGNPYRGVQQGYEIYSSMIPSKGTSVTLVIQEATKEEIQEVARYQEQLAELAEVRRKRVAEENSRKPLPPPDPFEILLYIDSSSSLSYQDQTEF